MTTKHRTRGFVFKKTDLAEADRIFSVVTEDFGRLEIRGKAIRKINSKLRAGVDLFCFSEIEFIQGKNNKTLTDSAKIDKFGNKGKDMEKVKIACQISDALDNFIKGQEKDESIWNLLIETFEKLNNSSIKPKKLNMIYYYFLWNFYSLLGYRPEVQKCIACKNKLNPCAVYFSNKEGGVICANCAKHGNGSQKINSDIVKVLRLILKKDWQTISRLKTEPPLADMLKETSAHYGLYLLSSHSFKSGLRNPAGVVE